MQKSTQLRAEYDHWVDVPDPFGGRLYPETSDHSNLTYPDRRSFKIKPNSYDRAAVDAVFPGILQDAQDRGFLTKGNPEDDVIVIGHNKSDVNPPQSLCLKPFSPLADVRKISADATDRENQLLFILSKRALESGCFDGIHLEFDTVGQQKEFCKIAKELFERHGLRVTKANVSGRITIEIVWKNAPQKMSIPFRFRFKDCEQLFTENARTSLRDRR